MELTETALERDSEREQHAVTQHKQGRCSCRPAGVQPEITGHKGDDSRAKQ